MAEHQSQRFLYKPSAFEIQVEGRPVARLDHIPYQNNRSQVTRYYDHIHDGSDSVSLVLHPRIQAYETKELPPFLKQNLPEGRLADVFIDLAVNNISTTRQELATYDPNWMILAMSGMTQIGRLQAVPMDEQGRRYKTPGYVQAQQNHFSKTDLVQDAHEYKERSNEEVLQSYFEQFAQQSGISGVFPKFLRHAATPGNQPRHLSLPTPQHIVKLDGDSDRSYGACVNEFLCMAAAGRAGLRIPGMTLSNSGHKIIIDRFDLQRDSQGSIRRLGMEEFHTLMLNERSAQKYGGTFEEAAREIENNLIVGDRASVDKGSDSGLFLRKDLRKQMLERLYIAHAIGDNDLHLKNMGVLYKDPREPYMAPHYDIVSGIQSPDMFDGLALKMEFSGDKQWLTHGQMNAFARSFLYESPEDQKAFMEKLRTQVHKGVCEVTQQAPGLVKRMPHLAEPIQNVAETLRERTERLTQKSIPNPFRTQSASPSPGGSADDSPSPS